MSSLTGRQEEAELVLRVRNVSKAFGPTIALENVDLEVRSGTVLVIAGPNGSGKSTLLKILCGIIRPSSGQATVFGVDPWKYRHLVFERTTAVFEDYSFPDLVSGKDYLKFILNLRGADTLSLDQIGDLFELHQFWRRSIRNYSSGMKRKLALAQALIGEARLIILDEPLIALDKTSRAELIEEIYKRKTNGSTILISSHMLVGLDKLADSFAVLINGRVVRQMDLSSEHESIDDLYKETMDRT